jgi:hypothetical protein
MIPGFLYRPAARFTGKRPELVVSAGRGFVARQEKIEEFRAGRYGSYRSAILPDWNSTRREMLIATRFGDTTQPEIAR